MKFRQMRQRVTFQELPWVDDGYGGNASDESDWQDLLTTWGDLNPTSSGKEPFEHGKLQTETEHKLEIRFRKGFSPKAKYRVKYTDPETNTTHYYNVLYFKNVKQANKKLEFRLKEVV